MSQVLTKKHNYLGEIRCPFCNSKAFIERYGLEYEINLGSPYYLFNRTYRCQVCETYLTITSKETNQDLNYLLEKDKIWAENLKSEKSN